MLHPGGTQAIAGRRMGITLARWVQCHPKSEA